MVLDGASSNMAMVKLLSGYNKGAFGIDNTQDDPHAVQPWFPNPQHPDQNIYFVICPTHQVLNDFLFTVIIYISLFFLPTFVLAR